MQCLRPVVGLAVLALVWGCGSERAQPIARLADPVGTVLVNAAEAHQGPVSPGDVIEVAPSGSCRLIFDDLSETKLVGQTAGASLTLPREKAGAVARVLELARGMVLLKVNKDDQAKSRYDVQTENCTASVEGTVFLVRHAEGVTSVLVSQGRVAVTAAGAAVTLKAGEGTTVARAGPATPPALYNPLEPDSPGAMLDAYAGPRQGRTTGGGASHGSPAASASPADSASPSPR